MEYESQSQKSKTCQTCRRRLPIYYFGILQSSSDCYNYTCKECRNYRRRQAYKKTEDFEYIPPLRDHNEMIFNLIESGQLPSPVSSILLPSREKIEVKIERSLPGYTYVSIWSESKIITATQFSDTRWDTVKPFLHDLFFRMGVRLCSLPND